MIKLAPSRAALAALSRLGVAFALLAALAAGVGLVGALGQPSRAPVAGPPPKQVLEQAPVSPGSAAPPAQRPLPEPEPQPQPDADPGSKPDPLRAWADDVASNVDVPARALVSYANADLAMRQYQPECRVSWATIAGIARIESDHGRYGKGLLREDARPSRPIIGVPLDGKPGVQVVPDTDGGDLDGDPTQDRAVGPLQFIPSTWKKWSTDGNGDGLGDPQNLDDAAMAAGRYLCSGGRDMTSGSGWWSGILSYNNSVDYGQKVFALADRYAEAGNRRR